MVPANPEMVLADHHLQEFLSRIHPCERFEVRVLYRDRKKGAHHRIFNAVAPAVDWIRSQEERLGDSVQGFYTTLNALHETTVGAAKDSDIAARRWILIDVDSERLVKTSATDEEKAASFKVIDRVAEYLKEERDWPLPLAIDSGNGYHALYELASDFPLNDIGDRQIKAFLEIISSRFSTDKAKVDVVVHNRSRITKLPGTWTRKGADSDDRPWRKATLLDVGEKGTISAEDIESVISDLSPDSSQNSVVQLFGGLPTELDDVTKSIIKTDLPTPAETPENIAVLEGMLKHVDPNDPRDTWLANVWSVASLGWDCSEQLIRSWSSKSSKYEESAFDSDWRSHDPGRADEITIATLIFHARSNGYDGPVFAQNELPLDEVAKDDKSGDAIDELNREFAWDQDNMAIYSIDQGRYVLKDRFLTQYGNRSITVEGSKGPKSVPLGKTWLVNPKRRDVPRIEMEPGQPPTLPDGGINSWRGLACEPTEGDVAPFLELLEWLFTDPRERKYILLWIALLVQKPGAKFNVALVIWSRNQGTGKSLLFETIGELFDERHYAVVGQEVFTSQFTDWQSDKVMVICDEISGTDKRSTADRIKGWVTASKNPINIKYSPAFPQPNRIKYVFLSNHADALYLDETDRRFFVSEATSERLSDEFSADYVSWRASGRAALLDYLLKVDTAGLNPTAPAPVSHAKTEMIQDNKSDLERWLDEDLSEKRTQGTALVSAEELSGRYSNERDTRCSSKAVSNALRKRQIPRISTQARLKAGGRRRVYALQDVEKYEQMLAGELGEAYQGQVFDQM